MHEVLLRESDLARFINAVPRSYHERDFATVAVLIPLILRTRLLQAIDDASHHVVVQACAGAGKSELALQLAKDAETQLFQPILDDPPEPDPAVRRLVIDLQPNCVDDGVLAELLRSHARVSTIVLLTRCLDPKSAQIADALTVRHLGTEDMLFDETELLQLRGSEQRLEPAEVSVLRGATAGWPQACLSAMGGWQTGELAELRSEAKGALDRSSGDAVDQLTAEERDATASLLLLDRFDRAICARLGVPDLITAMRRSGIPLLEHSDGWWSLLDPVRRQLLASSPSPRHLPPEVFEWLAESGRPIDGIQSAIAAGDVDTAARMYTELQMDQIATSDPARLDAIESLVGDQIDLYPRSALPRAWRHSLGGRASEAASALQAGLDRSQADGDTGLSEQLQAELASTYYFRGRTSDATALVGDPDGPRFSHPLARARQMEIQAGLLALAMDAESHERAVPLFRQAADAWRQADHHRSVQRVLTLLGVEVLGRQGRYTEAIEVLKHAARWSTMAPEIALNLLYSGRMYALQGRPEAVAALDAAADHGSSAGLDWVAAVAAAYRAILASYAGDTTAVAHQLRYVEDNLGPLMDHASGALLRADFVDAFARVGQRDKAFEQLALLQGHEQAEHVDQMFAEVVAHGFVGDATKALDAADSFEQRGWLVPGGQWRLPHLRSVASRRLGMDEDADALLGQAIEVARATDSHLSPDLDSPPECAGDRTGEYEIMVLDKFVVLRSGTPVTPPLGRQQTLIKLLALSDGVIAIDQAIDALWPDTGLDVGRRRLRNVLTRVRASSGDLVERIGDSLRLAENTRCDVTEWMGRAGHALETASGEELDRLIAIAPNLVLPDDRYEEWLQPAQRSYQYRLLALLDRRVVLAESVADVDAAVSSIARALEVEPSAFERAQAAVHLLRSAGRSVAASDFERVWLPAIE